MASNRLYIVDTDSGEHFMLCKSHGANWGVFDSEMGDELDKWLNGKDEKAQSGGKYTRLILVTENGSTINNAQSF